MKKVFDYILIMLLFAATMYWSFEFVWALFGAFYEEALVNIFMAAIGFLCLVVKIAKTFNQPMKGPTL